VRVFQQKLHSRLPLDPTHVRLKLLHACDQWHSSRKFTLLPVGTVTCVQTLKGRDAPLPEASSKDTLLHNKPNRAAKNASVLLWFDQRSGCKPWAIIPMAERQRVGLSGLAMDSAVLGLAPIGLGRRLVMDSAVLGLAPIRLWGLGRRLLMDSAVLRLASLGRGFEQTCATSL
jgi:hypothetical protein